MPHDRAPNNAAEDVIPITSLPISPPSVARDRPSKYQISKITQNTQHLAFVPSDKKPKKRNTAQRIHIHRQTDSQFGPCHYEATSILDVVGVGKSCAADQHESSRTLTGGGFTQGRNPQASHTRHEAYLFSLTCFVLGGEGFRLSDEVRMRQQRAAVLSSADVVQRGLS